MIVFCCTVKTADLSSTLLILFSVLKYSLNEKSSTPKHIRIVKRAPSGHCKIIYVSLPLWKWYKPCFSCWVSDSKTGEYQQNLIFLPNTVFLDLSFLCVRLNIYIYIKHLYGLLVLAEAFSISLPLIIYKYT